MGSSIVVAIIGGCFTLLGVWFNHYLLIQRGYLYREPAAQEVAATTFRQPEGLRTVSAVADSRKALLRDWQRGLLAIAICPLINLAAVAAAVISYLDDWSYISPSIVGEILLTVGPWLYASCIIILFPLLIFFYRRVTGQRARLIFAALTWCIHSGLFFLVANSVQGLTPDEAKLSIFSPIGGGISGLLYWFITRTSFQHRNALEGDRAATVAR